MSSAPDVPRAVIPTGHDAAGYTAVRSLARRDVGAVVASEKSGVPAAASRFCTEFVSVPSPRESVLAYRDALLELAEREAVVTVLPVLPEDAYVLSRYRDAFTEHVSLPVMAMPELRRVVDRLALSEAAEAAGVPVPDTRRLSDVDSWDGPLLVKSRYNVLADAYVDGYGPDDIGVEKALFHVHPGSLETAREIRDQLDHDPIVQEFVPRDGEFVVGALCDHGDPLVTFQHEQIRGVSYTGGGGVYRTSMYDPELDDIARTLLEELDYHGLACIEYMRDARTGEYVLTEINPRLWQSLPVAARAGADFPHDYWLQATGRTDEISAGYDVGVGSHLIHGELGYLASVLRESSPHVDPPSFPRAVWRVVSSCITDPHFDYLALDDPGPFLAGLRQFVSK